MKRRFSSRITFLPVTLTVLGVVGVSCGLRETRSNSATSLLGQVQKASNAGAVTATPKVSVQIDEIRKQLRDATEFWKLSLAQESKERKEADEAIRADVVSLSEKLEAMRVRLDSEISRLDKTLREEFSKQLSDLNSDLSKRISEEKAAREQAIQLVDQNLRKESSALASAIQNLDDRTKSDIQAVNAKLSSVEAQLKQEIATQRAELSQKILDKEAELKTVADADRAKTQAELSALKAQLAETKASLVDQLRTLEVQSAKSQAQLKAEVSSWISASEETANAKFADLQGQLKLARASLASQQASLKRQQAELANTNARINTEISQLQASDVETKRELERSFALNKALQDEMKKSESSLATRIQTLDLVTQKQLSEVKDELTSKIIDNGSELENLITLARDEAQKNLLSAVGESKAQMVAAMTAADDALRSDLAAKISSESAKQSAALQSFKREVDATYAKQVDLVALQNVVNGLSNALNILDHKVDENDKRLDASLRNLRADLVGRISNVQASVASLRGEFRDHVETYNSKVSELSAQTRDAARELRREMVASAVHSAEAQEKLRQRIENLNSKLTNTEDFAIKTREALTNKIVELERRDGELSNEVREARNDATAQLSAAIAKEQQARQAIANDVKKLQAEVERVSQVAGQALALSQANDLAISGVREELQSVRSELKTKIEELRTDMTKGLQEVSTQAKAIMMGLGLTTQSQFGETAAQLANVRQKAAGLLLELGRSLAKGMELSVNPLYSSESARAEAAAAFNKKVSSDLSQTVNGERISLQEFAQRRMGEMSKVLGRIESEFLLAVDYAEVLNDNQKTEDLRAMNLSFIRDVVSKNSNGTLVCSAAEAGRFDSGVNHLKATVKDVPYVMSAVNGSEFWAQLARAYAQLVLSGARTGDAELDKIFHGSAPLADGQSLQSALAMASVPSLAAGAGGECVSRVNDWAKSVLFGSAPESVRLRTALHARIALKRILAEGSLEAAYKGLSSPASSIETLAKDALKPAFGNDEAKVMAYLRAGVASKGNPGFFASAAQIIHEYGATRAQQQAIEQNLESLTEVARAYANQNGTLDTMNDKIESLRSRLAEFDKLRAQTDAIGAGTVNSLGLIAAMAARLGYDDIVEKSKAEIKKLADVASVNASWVLPMGCTATSHFFNYAEENQPLKRCDSGVSTSEGNYGDNGKCRTTQTVTTTINTNVNTHSHTQYNYTTYQTFGAVRVVNTRGCHWRGWCYDNWTSMGSTTMATGSSTSTSTSVSTNVATQSTLNQAIVGALSVPWLSPLDANARTILRRAEGSPFPTDRKTMIGLRIFGNADKWRIEDPESGRRIELNAEDYRVAETAKGIIYEIPASMFLAKSNGQAGFTEAAKITALTSDGKVAVVNNAPAKTCLHSMNGGTHNVSREFRTYSTSSSSSTSYNYGGAYYMQGYQGVRYYTSPLVLDLQPGRKLETIAPDVSSAMFDLQATGLKRRVGWIANGTGLLALDLNGNGKIDNGRELFGDFTKLKSGALASNGYEALAEHDSNKDGIVDNKDRVFSKLVLWVDDNADGMTQKGELKKLSQLGITGIGVKYEQAAADERMQNRGNVKNNLVLYKARYFGTNCPANGCRSYDVYFGYDDLVKPVAAK